MKVKFLATTGIIAALYIAVTMLVAPFGFTEVQFRISEMFNHLVAFNPRFLRWDYFRSIHLQYVLATWLVHYSVWRYSFCCHTWYLYFDLQICEKHCCTPYY